MAEPLLTYLMPLYAASSWAGLVNYHRDGAWMLPVSGFGAAWAIFNTLKNGRLDAGFVTMGTVAVFAVLEARQGEPSSGVCLGQTVGCALAAANYSVPIAAWKMLSRKLVKRKSPFFMKTYWIYLVTNILFWLVAAYSCHSRSKAISGASMK
mmetsp:Transcript_58558/g.117602  ORF Transcript_58558/g.117602 Transcript_58558/m.117602 type:complete len:152 (-) Transcript_58558:264-719(-)|eukprot:CAMPEP_0171623958 /NCGR_PEP_ID=MMETSP0990-20121206/18288_1 /TAXON_ID=483369 /ORGANISM="non described non described, Strain CCMP2098" /LENGTH=151 /DNA_ID=CAMNT_0012190325 /DNA_START=14 /DNA_END=469 /DNA_ORIENTATION=+